MPITRIALGRRDEITHPAALKAALAEFISTLLFVFAGQGSAVAYRKLTHGIPTPSGILVVAISHAFALSVAVSISANVSGGHVNPAVTVGVLIGGNLTLFRAILYCVAQLLGSVAGCILLMLCTGNTGNSLGVFAVSGITSGSALLFEMVMTFGLVYTVYATAVDPKKGEVGIIAPVTIGLVVGANILAGGLYTGACMNPAVAFGPALVSWKWTDHWIYWAGPLLGGGGAALLYNILLVSPQHGHVQVNVTDDY